MKLKTARNPKGAGRGKVLPTDATVRCVVRCTPAQHAVWRAYAAVYGLRYRGGGDVSTMIRHIMRTFEESDDVRTVVGDYVTRALGGWVQRPR